MNAIRLRPPPRLAAVVRPPGSKSLTNRALALAAIAEGPSRIEGALDAEDTRLMVGCLRALGLEVTHEGDVLELDGAAGPFRFGGEPALDVGTAGTVARFLTPLLAVSHGRAQLDGSERMRERPMGMLIEALRSRGADIECLGEEGFVPLTVGRPRNGAKPGLRGGEIRLTRPASSQFISGLVLSALLADSATEIILEEGTPARPYVDMTLATVVAFGGDARWLDGDTLHVEPGRLHGRTYRVEPDASGASYFLGLAAIHGGSIEIPDLGHASLQGDAGFARVLERMGAEVEQDATRTRLQGRGSLRGGDFDLADMPDMTPTLAVTAAFAGGPSRIRGVAVLRHHESDRITALATELRKLGVRVVEHEDGLDIDPPADGLQPGVEVDTWRDHRMAMALALVGDIVVRDPGCVAKTYPHYFDELAKLGMVASA